MSPQRRELILMVADGVHECLPVLYHFDRFIHAERILSWLIKNKITGKKFLDVYQNEFKFSWLTFGKWIVAKINKEKELKPIIGGKDYKI